MATPFVKMSGSGNDFIFIDNRAAVIDSEAQGLLPEMARRLCARRIGIGADGLVLIEDDPEVDFRWRFYNSDGSEAEMCGNAGRCAARLAFEWGLAGPEHTFRTKAGLIRAKVDGRRVRVQLTTPFDIRPDLTLDVDGREHDASFINTGVPHTVLFTDDPDQVAVNDIGSKIRYHDDFTPAGTNVNFVRVTGPDSLAVRTYERGVEAETLACGTGVTASALLAGLKGLTKPPTRVMVRSGEELIVDFRPNPEAADPWPGAVYFEGITTKVYTGSVSEEMWP